MPTGHCDGLADAAYPGSGVNQHCAFNDFRYLYSDGTYNNKAWVIAGGDTVIVRGGPWRVGQKGPNPKDYFGNDAGNPYGAYNPPIPAGTAAQHTRILGEHYGNCTAKTQLFGGYAVGAVLNLKDTHHVDVECLDLTDHAQCTRVGAGYPSSGGCRSSYPLSDYAGSGIITNKKTMDVLLQDLDIHGFTSRGIIGAIGGVITVNRVRVAYNGGAGWDFDDGSGTKSINNPAVKASYLTVEWNGCNEEYPIVHAYPAYSCFDQNSGGYGDGIGTPDTPLSFTLDHGLFRFNTQDGFDLLHVSGSNIRVTNSQSYGNMGQQWKLGAMASVVFQNNLTLTNCHRMSAAMTGTPANYNHYLSNYCRAAGDGLALNLAPGGTLMFQNNTIVGYSATTFDFGCGGADCSSSSIIYQNNIVLGYSNPSYNSGQLPGLFYFGSGARSANFKVRSNNLYYNVRHLRCPTGYPNEQCADPKFKSEPKFTAEWDLDGLDLHLSVSSPARRRGTSVPAILADYDGYPRRPQGNIDIGAFQH